jgi:hypothetical protein
MNKYNKYILLTSFALAAVSCLEKKIPESIEPISVGQTSSNNTNNHHTSTNSTTTTKPVNTSTNNTTPPNDASIGVPTPPSDDSTDNATPPNDDSTDATLPNDDSTDNATPPNDDSTTDATLPNDDSTNNATPPNDNSTDSAISPNNTSNPTEAENPQQEEKLKREGQKKQLEQNLAQARADLVKAEEEYVQEKKRWEDLNSELNSTVFEKIKEKELAINRLQTKTSLTEFKDLNGLGISYYQNKISIELATITKHIKTIGSLKQEKQILTDGGETNAAKFINLNSKITHEEREMKNAEVKMKQHQECIRPVLEKIETLKKECDNVKTANAQKIEEHRIANEAYIQAGSKKIQLTSQINYLQEEIMLLGQNKNQYN